MAVGSVCGGRDAVAEGDPMARELLTALYDGTGGPHWTRSDPQPHPHRSASRFFFGCFASMLMDTRILPPPVWGWDCCQLAVLRHLLLARGHLHGPLWRIPPDPPSPAKMSVN